LIQRGPQSLTSNRVPARRRNHINGFVADPVRLFDASPICNGSPISAPSC